MSTEQDGLTAALRAEYAAVYAYGIVQAYSLAPRQTSAAEFVDAHRAQRDALAAALTATGTTPPAAAAAYNLPTQVTDPTSAAKLAVTAEDECAQAYRVLLADAGDDGDRRLALTGLTGAATRAARWRIALNVTPSTPPFPGSKDQ
ncbi:ferritin-like domain-containing protein [Tsukamurella soli]|uniref:Ferritin-like domain-containing protein n=1 Tax=Tsukamurella soli TaxID=644556 RepID=A0ABP8KJ32_9ACTN